MRFIYGVMFFENVFTCTGWEGDIEDGIKKHWNVSFLNSKITWEDVKVIVKYRHTLVHDDAQKAQSYLKSGNGSTRFLMTNWSMS